MAKLFTGRPRVARRGRVRRLPRAMTGRERGRAGSSGPAATIGALLAACGVGALAEYVLDRQHGARRRHMLRDRVRAALRRRSRNAVRRAKYLEGVAEGVAYKAAHAVPGVSGHRSHRTT
jgi:hypothetical protein